MSTIFDIRSVRLPKLSAKVVVGGGLAALLAMTAVFLGVQLYRKLSNTTVIAYFPETLALYPGDKVQIMGVRVGAIDKIEPDGDQMRVTLHYSTDYQVPANATATILNPSLVASRTIQLSPPYTGRGSVEGRRGDPDRAHPGARRVGSVAGVDQRPAPGPRSDSAAAEGAVR